MHILSCAQFFACSLAQNELDLRENQEEGESFFLHVQCQVEEEESGGTVRKESLFFFSFVVGREGENLLFLFGIHRRKVGKSSLFL